MSWLICSLLLVITASYSFAGEVSLERWDRAICLHTERKITDGQPAFASGFVIELDKRLYLVSAVHAAQETHAKTRIVYRTIRDESRWVYLGGLVDSTANPWVHFENTDLAVAPLRDKTETTSYHAELNRLAIPLATLQPELPKRTAQIEITGFPMSLGSDPPISPLVIVTHVASREFQATARWGTESVFCAVPTAASGSSGGPVYELITDPSETKVVGMYIGLASDSTGAKLSKIIPARVIRTALEKIAARPTEDAK